MRGLLPAFVLTVALPSAVMAQAPPPLSKYQPGADPCSHGQLAREYVVTGVDARDAYAEWETTLNGGGAVAWTATLYDLDAQSIFVVAFDRAGIRIYTLGQLAAPLTRHMGVVDFPGPDRAVFWRTLTGCPPGNIAPVAEIPWSEVREIGAGNWVLWFRLAHKVPIQSDRQKRKSLDGIMVNLHGGDGNTEYRANGDPRRGVHDLRGIGTGPAAYQERVRHTLVHFFDPQGRIVLPKQKKGAGW
jgi:hypothetical protein